MAFVPNFALLLFKTLGFVKLYYVLSSQKLNLKILYKGNILNEIYHPGGDNQYFLRKDQKKIIWSNVM